MKKREDTGIIARARQRRFALLRAGKVETPTDLQTDTKRLRLRKDFEEEQQRAIDKGERIEIW